MPTQSEALESVHRSLADLPAGRWLLAVSGGRDSMALLDAFASARGHELAGVALRESALKGRTRYPRIEPCPSGEGTVT